MFVSHLFPTSLKSVVCCDWTVKQCVVNGRILQYFYLYLVCMLILVGNFVIGFVNLFFNIALQVKLFILFSFSFY